MAAGDAHRVCFPEMEEHLRLRWRDDLSMEALLGLCDELDDMLCEGPAHYNFTVWSPTADVIAFTADSDGDSEIYTVHTDGSMMTRLTRSPGNDAHAAWSPDGQWIAFTTVREGFKDESVLHPGNPQPNGEIVVMRADGSDVRVLTDNPFEDGSPAWRPPRERR